MSLLSPRPLHNKENSHHQSSCLPSFVSKPTLSGLGRSPKKKSTHVHGAKPYSRSTSVHKPTAKPIKGGKVKKVPAPLDLTAVKKSVERERTKTGEVKIPLSLPRINVPLVPHLDEFFDANVPFEYVRSKLLPRLSGFGIVSAQFRPYTSVPTPRHLSQSEGHRPTMAFGVPAIVEGKAHPHLAAKLHGRVPDVCLAITKQGDSTMKAPASLVPVNQLVFASQCYHWPRLIDSSNFIVRDTDASSTASTERSPSPELDSIKEEEEDEPVPALAQAPAERDSDYNTSSATSVSTPPTFPEVKVEGEQASFASNFEIATPQAQPWLHLPIQQLPLPSPETYPILHNLLHFTHSPAPSSFSPVQNLLGMDVAGLFKLETVELMKKLNVIHGVWKNCWYLGIGDIKIWVGMRDAWGAVVGIVGERSKRGGGGDVNMKMNTDN